MKKQVGFAVGITMITGVIAGLIYGNAQYKRGVDVACESIAKELKNMSQEDIMSIFEEVLRERG